MSRPPGLRAVASLLLVVSAVVFVIGVAVERSQGGESAEQRAVASGAAAGAAASTIPAGNKGTGETAGETGKETGAPHSSTTEGGEGHIESLTEGAPATAGAVPPETGGEVHREAKLLGINPESIGLVAAVAALSLLLAVALWRRDSSLVLLVVAAFGLVFAAFDVREAFHQADESRDELVALALVVAALHLGVAGLAGVLLARRRLRGPRRALEETRVTQQSKKRPHARPSGAVSGPVFGRTPARSTRSWHWSGPGLAIALVCFALLVAKWPHQGADARFGPVAQVRPTAAELADLATGPQVGRLAPNFLLPTNAGKTLRLSDLRGHPVFLNFWATWCAECKGEMPDMQQLADHEGERVAVVGVNASESVAAVGAFARHAGIRYPLLLDPRGAVAAVYGVRGIPTSLFLDAAGMVRAVSYGPLTGPQMESRLAPLLAGSG